MSEEFDLEIPELTEDDLLVLDGAFPSDAVALVTGAASGIGRATAAGLAANGVHVVGVDIDEDGMERTAETVEEITAGSETGQGSDGGFESFVGDLTDADDVEASVEAAADAGDLRYVANVAGVQHVASLEHFPTGKYDFLLDVMLRAPFLLAKHALPHVRDTDDGRGAIANMSSVHGHTATQDKAAYITAKHGLNGLTRAIAAEGEGTVRSFTVSVGYVLTPLMVNQIEDSARERGISEREVVEDVMLGPARTKELMAPAEVANLFTFGCSRHGRHLNGGDLLWDGGFTTTYE